MKIRNNLFLILFKSKEENRWETWKKFAFKNNYSYSTVSDPYERPIIRGQINNKPISVEAVYDFNHKEDLYLQIKSPIHNPRDLFLLVQDKKVLKSKSGIFDKCLHGICEEKEIEDRFFVKSNSERLSTLILNYQGLSKELLNLNNFTIELIDYELILTSYNLLEINKEFIEFLKLFYTFLLAFDQFSLEASMNRK